MKFHEPFSINGQTELRIESTARIGSLNSAEHFFSPYYAKVGGICMRVCRCRYIARVLKVDECSTEWKREHGKFRKCFRSHTHTFTVSVFNFIGINHFYLYFYPLRAQCNGPITNCLF